MQDTKLFETILGIQAPWHISRVVLSPTEERVDLWAKHDDGVRWPCPECGTELAVYDHAEERAWRHLDTCQYQTFLHARVPRVNCRTHGVRQVKVPWSEPRSRFTALFERLIIDVIQQCSTVMGACRILGITWDEAWRVMDRAVRRGQARKEARAIAYLGVDEKAFRKGRRFHTIVCDIAEGKVEYVGEGNRAATLEAFYGTLTTEQREAIRGVAMDMWDPYIKATRDSLAQGNECIVFDRFHVMGQLTRAVDLVRKQEDRALLRSTGTSGLKGSKYLWLYSSENLPERYQATFEQLRCQHVRMARAWAIKEQLRKLWDLRDVTAARQFFKKWYHWARCSRLQPITRAAATLKRYSDGVLRYVLHPITNGVAEGLNSKIMSIKRKACGFRNADHFTTAIYFHCGGLDLYPR
jgi:transposase